MDDDTERQLQLLAEMRDLLREDVRLRQVAMEEQRTYQARAQASIAAAGTKQRNLNFLLLGIVVLLFASSFLAPVLFSLFGLLTGGRGPLSLGSDALVPSTVDTARFDGHYSLLPDASFTTMRALRDAEADPVRRQQLEGLLQHAVEQYAHFRVRHGVIRSGTQLIQELSLRQAQVEGDTLHGVALWHEDVGDPGDASEVSVLLRLKGNTLEFAMLGEKGEANAPIVLIRVGA